MVGREVVVNILVKLLNQLIETEILRYRLVQDDYYTNTQKGDRSVPANYTFISFLLIPGNVFCKIL